MDKASDFGSEDCEFESRRGQNHFALQHHTNVVKFLKRSNSNIDVFLKKKYFQDMQLSLNVIVSEGVHQFFLKFCARSALIDKLPLKENNSYLNCKTLQCNL